MRLADLEAGISVFIDANIFIYHFTGASSECAHFFGRCETGELAGITSVTALAEVCHRLMAIEAVNRHLIPAARPLLSLQKHPQLVRKLSLYGTQIAGIMTWPIKILEAPADLVLKSQTFRTQFGLLTYDSFIPVFMQAAGTTHLASNDRIFGSIPSIKLYSPCDL